MFRRIGKRLLDPVLIIAWILAMFSAVWVKPTGEYFGYIDWRSLGILWSLMVIIQGFRENAIFEKIAGKLLKKVNKAWQLAGVVILMCFIGSMLITNDVALITFVPFAMMILHSCGRDDMMIMVVVLQTIAANLGSMFTPIGNPQNLYLYGLTGMGIAEFVSTMFPYTIAAAFGLGLCHLFLPGRNKAIETGDEFHIVKGFGSIRQIIIYSILFLLALLTVIRVIPWYMLAVIVFVIVAGMDVKILFQADYVLLLTFIGFFVFTGNVGRIPEINLFLQSFVRGKEFFVSVITSQLISNVPATLMLSDFASNQKELLIGVNVGGLGTLIASMASLISYKAYASAHKDHAGKYLLIFTGMNLLFLAGMVLLHILLNS